MKRLSLLFCLLMVPIMAQAQGSLSCTAQPGVCSGAFIPITAASTTRYVMGNASGMAALTNHTVGWVTTPSTAGIAVTVSASTDGTNFATQGTSTNGADNVSFTGTFQAVGIAITSLTRGTVNAGYFGDASGVEGTITSITFAAPLTGGTITVSGTVGCPTCVVGPSSATDKAFAEFNTSTGKLLQDSGLLLPVGFGTSGYFLSTDGMGATSWAVGGGGGISGSGSSGQIPVFSGSTVIGGSPDFQIAGGSFFAGIAPFMTTDANGSIHGGNGAYDQGDDGGAVINWGVVVPPAKDFFSSGILNMYVAWASDHDAYGPTLSSRQIGLDGGHTFQSSNVDYLGFDVRGGSHLQYGAVSLINMSVSGDGTLVDKLSAYDANSVQTFSGAPALTTVYVYHANDLGSGLVATNPYYSWFDSRGVDRCKEDKHLDSTGQSICTLYDHQFAKYIPGNQSFQRLVKGQYNNGVPEIGAEAGPTQTLTSVTSSSTTATATKTNHGYQTGDSVTMAGADQTEYNGTYTVTCVDSPAGACASNASSSFTYTFAGSMTTPATGTITAQSGVLAPVRIIGKSLQIASGGAATKIACFGSDGKTIGYATMLAGDISTCNTP